MIGALITQGFSIEGGMQVPRWRIVTGGFDIGQPSVEPEVKPFGDSLPVNHVNPRIVADAGSVTLQLDSKHSGG